MISQFIRFSVIAVILSLLHGKPVLAQSYAYGGYYLEHFTDENGLPQNSINDLLFDDKGFLWLASQVGLVRFDGYSFKSYAPLDKPLLGSNFLALGKCALGGIYGLRTDRQIYRFEPGNKPSLRLLGTTLPDSPFLLNRKQLIDFRGFLESAPTPAIHAQRRIQYDTLYNNNRRLLAVDPKHFYFTYGDSLYYFGDGGLSVLAPAADQDLQYLIFGENLYTIKKDLILAVYRRGQKVGHAPLLGGDLEKDESGRLRDKDTFRLFAGNQVYLMINRRLYLVTETASGYLRGDFQLDIDFANNISVIDGDPRLDLLLVATQTEGFYAIWKSRFDEAGLPAGLKGLFSHYLFGPLALRDGEDILTDRFVFNTSGKYRLLQPRLLQFQKTLYIDKKEQVWTSFNNKPWLLDKQMKPIKAFPDLDGPIADYAEDRDGRLFCLTDRSLWRLDTTGFHLVFRNTELNAKQANECIRLVNPNEFWIGGHHGLIAYDLRDPAPRRMATLNDAHIRCISTCTDGSVFLGTYGQGYYYYHHGHFFHMPLDRNAFLITAHCFLEDRKGMVWISCNKGLFKIPRADLDAWCDARTTRLYYYYYGRQDGLKTNEFNGGFNASGLITKTDFAVMLSMKGMVCFYTDSLRSEFPTGPIGISDIEIDPRARQKEDSIGLPPDYSSLVLEISCPFLGNRNNLYLEYNLKGLDDEWKDVPNDGVVNLSRLAPGHYALRVRKVDGFGNDHFSYRTWDISIAPHFYQTSWFVALAALLFFTLMFLLIQSRLNLIQKRKEVRIKAETLNNTVRKLEETVEKLQGSQKALLQTSKMREKLISLVIHDLRSPIRFLSMLAADLHDNLTDLSPGDLKDRAYGIKKGASELYTFSEDFLLWVSSQRDHFTITERSFLLLPLLQEIHEFFKEQVLQKGNSLTIEAAEGLRMRSDPHILITIIRNLVDNANKYTSQGSIAIRAYGEGGYIFVSVTDTGKGMTAEQIGSFLRVESLEDIKSGSQLGHKFVADLTRRIHGVVSIDSRVNEGTTVLLRFDKTRIDGD